MAYASWSVVADEQPTTAKWNILGTNDAAFVDGSGMTLDRCEANRTTTQSINDSTLTTVALDAELIDTNSLHSTVTNNSRITIAKTGLYLVFCQIAWVANTSGRRFATIIKNGSAIDTDLSDNRAPTSAGEARNSIFKLLSLTAGDYLEAQVLQNSGGALNIQLYSYFGVVQLSGSSS